MACAVQSRRASHSQASTSACREGTCIGMLPRPAVRSTSGRRACTASALLPASAWRPIHSRRRPPRAHANRSAGPAATDDAPQQLQLKLPSAEFSRIKKAVFVRSSVDLKGCPPEKYPEFAVIGRSNVGKSSLINMLTSSDGLAKVSKEPGMTKTINHFLINDAWYLVDLPGYGYAKSNKQSKVAWISFTQEYFLQRDMLVSVLLLVDSSIPPQPVDLECANWLAEAEVPFAIVFTKSDMKKKGGPAASANIAAFKRELLKGWEAVPACFVTSSREGKGKTEVLQYLASLRGLQQQEEEQGAA